MNFQVITDSSRTFCNINKDSMLIDKNVQFLEKLISLPDKKVKVISAIGAKGHGKSTVLNNIIQGSPEFQTHSRDKEPFELNKDLSENTQGIYFYQTDYYDESYLFLDCFALEEIDEENDFQKRLKYLIFLICKISTVVIHVTSSLDKSKTDFTKILKILEIERSQKNQQNDDLAFKLIEVVNRQQSENQNQETFPKLQEVFYLQEIVKERIIQYDDIDEIQEQDKVQYNQVVFTKIKEIILKAQYNSQDLENFDCSRNENTFINLHKILKLSLTILESEKPPEETKFFLKLVNESIRIDSKCRKAYEDAKQILDIKFNQINSKIKQDQIVSSYLYTQIIIPSQCQKQDSITKQKIKEIYSKWKTDYIEIKSKLEQQQQSYQSLILSYDEWYKYFPENQSTWNNEISDEFISFQILVNKFSKIFLVLGFLIIFCLFYLPRLILWSLILSILCHITAINLFLKQTFLQKAQKMFQNSDFKKDITNLICLNIYAKLIILLFYILLGFVVINTYIGGFMTQITDNIFNIILEFNLLDLLLSLVVLLAYTIMFITLLASILLFVIELTIVYSIKILLSLCILTIGSLFFSPCYDFYKLYIGIAYLIVGALFLLGVQLTTEVKIIEQKLLLQNINQLNKNWQNIAFNSEKNTSDFNQSTRELLQKYFKQLNSKLLLINSYFKKQYFTILLFVNIIFSQVNNDDKNTIKQFQKHKNILFSALEQYKQEFINQKSSMPDEIFQKIYLIKQSVQENNFEFNNGQIQILNKELLNQIDEIYKPNTKLASILSLFKNDKNDKWKNIFSILTVLKNLHPNLMNLFIIEAFFENKIANQDCFSIFSNEDTIYEFLQFQSNLITN